MKCKKCGHRAKDINGMRKHYMKAHPGAMKHHGPRKRRYHGNGETRDTPVDAIDIMKWHVKHYHGGA